MAEATGTEITNTNTGILSRISEIFANVKKLRSDPAVQKFKQPQPHKSAT